MSLTVGGKGVFYSVKVRDDVTEEMASVCKGSHAVAEQHIKSRCILSSSTLLTYSLSIASWRSFAFLSGADKFEL